MKQTSPKHRKHVHHRYFVARRKCIPESRANVFSISQELHKSRSARYPDLMTGSAVIKRRRVRYITDNELHHIED
jgi:hypothetical protein